MPKLQEGNDERDAAKMAELQPYIDAALARKVKMPDIAEEDIPSVTSFGRRKKEAGQFENFRSDRGGGVAIVADDPLAAVANAPEKQRS